MNTALTFRTVAQQESPDNLLGLVLGLIALSIGLAALLLLCELSFPNLVARTRRNAERMPIRSILIGLINCTFFGVIAAGLLSGDQGARVLGLIVATILHSFMAVGRGAIAQRVGERLRPHDSSAVRRLLAGAATLELAALVPLVGWFMVPALAGLLGYGALVIALVQRRKNREPVINDKMTR
jgi:hypothetical protein